MKKLYVFLWPSHLGGADTRLAHTLKIWSSFMDVTVIPNHADFLKEEYWTNYLKKYNCKYDLIENLPDKLDGIAISMCNDIFFVSGRAKIAKEKGLYVIWSSEMMWHHQGELDAIMRGIVDCVLYTSDFQKSILQPNYIATGKQDLKQFVIGNYIDPEDFPYIERQPKVNNLNIGRVSRSDPLKYPKDFPLIYERLGLSDPNFHIMGFDDNLKMLYKWYNFSDKWYLYRSAEIPVLDFLKKLDIFVYSLGETFKESWGRSVAEAMLTGCCVVVPSGHTFESFISNGVNGYIYSSYDECASICRMLEIAPDLRLEIGKKARQSLIENALNINNHINKWKEIFNV